MANTRDVGGRFGLFLLMLFLAGTAAAQNCGGTERWGPKDCTDSQAQNIDLTNITPEAVTDLVAIHQPPLPGDNKTRIVPDETHVYRVQARLVKWRRETSDNDYHLVLTDDTLSYTDEGANPPVPATGHSFIGEVPDPSCFSGRDGIIRLADTLRGRYHFGSPNDRPAFPECRPIGCME